MESPLNGSEAVYGFMGWLTTTNRFTDCALAAELVAEFCDVNKLPEPREGWHKVLKHPEK